MRGVTDTNKLHPLIATAAVAVTSVSVLGAVLLITNQVSARHAAAPEAAVAAMSAPAPTDAESAPKTAEDTVSAPVPAPAPSKPRARRVSNPTPAPIAPHEPPPVVQAAVPPVIAQAPACYDCGIVTSVREIKAPGEGSGVGVIAGGVVGGVIGNQIGRGHGKDAARILGAIGGAVAGHQIEKQARATTRYEVTVRMEDGSLRTLTHAADPGVRAGDRVRVDGNAVRAVQTQTPDWTNG